VNYQNDTTGCLKITYKVESIIYKIFVGANSISGTVSQHFNHKIPDGVFGWDNTLPKKYLWLFIVPKEDIESAHEQCKGIQLRNFIIVADTGMIAGG
jgi:hypothetical protein